MEIIKNIVDLFLHLDVHLVELTEQYGTATYSVLFAVIFAETGFVFTPFLPGDSLLFAAGSLAALGALNVHLLVLILVLAAVGGDNTNYWIGRSIGLKLFRRFPRVLKQEYLDRTQGFYEKYGGKTMILARYVPIVRTFAPFVAGLGEMRYRKYLSFDLAGAVSWICIFVYGGYFFGNLPFVKKNFSIVVLAIVLVSVTPGIIEYIKHRAVKKRNSEPEFMHGEE